MRCCWLLLFVFLLLSGCISVITPDINLDATIPEQTKSIIDHETDPPSEDTLPSQNTSENEDLTQDTVELQHHVEDDLGLMKDSLKHLSETPRVWRDTSLGCPQPGMVYAQVLTDGWLFVFETSDGIEIPVHAERGLNKYIICTEEVNTDSKEENSDLRMLPVLQTAIRQLSESLGVPESNIDFLGFESKLWPNSCLGCAGSEENCLMVVTPGYKVQFAVDGRGYTLHTNDDASVTRLCTKNVSLTLNGE